MPKQKEKFSIGYIYLGFTAGVVFTLVFTGAFGPRFSVEGSASPPALPLSILYKVTAYCPCEKCCGECADGITACGHRIQPGDKFVAAPPYIPFGTILNIPGYGSVPVLDRGGVIKGNRLDVFFPTHQEALEWGVKYLRCNQEATFARMAKGKARLSEVRRAMIPTGYCIDLVRRGKGGVNYYAIVPIETSTFYARLKKEGRN